MGTAGAEARAAVAEVLDRGVSPLLASAGFRPRTQSLTYRRRLAGEVRHVLRFHVETRGEVEGAWVRSTCLLSHDAVSAQAHAWWSASPHFPDGPFPDEYDVLLDLLPGGSQRRRYGAASASELAEQLAGFVERTVRPLLDEVREPGCLAPVKDAGRLGPTYENGAIYVAVAEAVAGRPEQAASRLRAFAERRPASLRGHLHLDRVLARLGDGRSGA